MQSHDLLYTILAQSLPIYHESKIQLHLPCYQNVMVAQSLPIKSKNYTVALAMLSELNGCAIFAHKENKNYIQLHFPYSILSWQYIFSIDSRNSRCSRELNI